jgi:single-stranded-DNA-specific exonuclease
MRRTTARILAGRKVDTVEAARRFLAPSPADLHDPFLLMGMDRAIDRIERAIASGERIMIAGDYDVDGVTATALYLELFSWLGKSVIYRIPHRLTEGYGLTEAGVRAALDQGVSLLITADCGTTAHAPIELANRVGIDVIVTDHHEPQDQIPPAYALLNPHVPGSSYPEKVLCAAGIAFKVAQALLSRRRSLPGVDARLASVLDLVALGTIADVAPLRGENRYLVVEGLRALSAGRRVGVAALKEICGIERKPVDAGTVGFQLGPRINAAGRLATAHPGVILLTTTDAETAMKAARELDAANQERRRIEEAMLDGAIAKVERGIALDHARSIVIADEAWHPGVIRIIASRVVDRWHRPTIVIAIGPDGAQGFRQASPGFTSPRRWSSRSLFEGFGGHAAAAGLTIQADLIPAFREQFESAVAANVGPDAGQPILALDDEVGLADITFPLVGEIATLAPFGMGNPEPLLTTSGCGRGAASWATTTSSCSFVTHRRHVRRHRLRPGTLLPPDPSPIDLAYSARVESWQGQDRIQLRLKDLRPSDRAV